ncbi:hypothetical protein GDO86_012109 [Hymenochirus boettgeri]|uniref:Uncharacterized protein n=1 Tax=Hymenochirus boettgeri TaxID=247094 RepID=A0A8T2JM45_9PIPI|nr:hypothetical protein GDO86_012109 [Hymenochirus boettgeri]
MEPVDLFIICKLFLNMTVLFEVKCLSYELCKALQIEEIQAHLIYKLKSRFLVPLVGLQATQHVSVQVEFI